MTKWWLIAFLMAGFFGDKAFADCLPAPDTPAVIIEHFQKFNKPLPEQFCAKKAVPHESLQAEEAPDQAGDVDDGPADRPFAQYEGDPGDDYGAYQEGGYESDQGGGYDSESEWDYESDQDNKYEPDQFGAYESDGGGEWDPEGSYEWGPEGSYEGGPQGSYEWGRERDRGYGNDYKRPKSAKHRKRDGKKGKGHGKRKSACKKAHMKWNESTKTCTKRR